MLSTLSDKSNLLTDEQTEVIIDILINQCTMLGDMEKENRTKFPELYDKDYMRNRSHSYTGMILAGFRENTKIPGMIIEKIRYGKYIQPQMSSDLVILHLYNGTNPLNSKTVQKFCMKYNQENSRKQYAIIQFFINETPCFLMKTELVYLDYNANIKKRELLYKHKAQIYKVS